MMPMNRVSSAAPARSRDRGGVLVFSSGLLNSRPVRFLFRFVLRDSCPIHPARAKLSPAASWCFGRNPASSSCSCGTPTAGTCPRGTSMRGKRSSSAPAGTAGGDGHHGRQHRARSRLPLHYAIPGLAEAIRRPADDEDAGSVPGRFKHDLEIAPTEHPGYQWFDWRPPHAIQQNTVDPLLAAVEEYRRIS